MERTKIEWALRRLGVNALVVAVLVGLTIVHTWPLATAWRTHVAGARFEDVWMNMWHIHWWRESFLHGKNPFFAPQLHWPIGAELYWHTHAPAKSVLGALLLPTFGVVGAYNLVCFSTFVLTGLTAFWLMGDVARRAGATGWRADAAAFVGACVFDFSRYHLCQALAHMNLAAVEGMPLFLFFFFRALEPAHRRAWIGASLAAGYVILCDFYYVYYLALFATFWLLWRAWQRGPVLSWAWLKSDDARVALKLAAGASIACLPAVVPLLLHLKPAPLAIHHGDSDFPLDLTMPFLPDMLSVWQSALPQNLAEAARRMQSALLNEEEGGTFVGYVTLALTFLGAWVSRARARPFVLVGLAFAVLALGPFLFAGGSRDLPVQALLVVVAIAAVRSRRLRRYSFRRDALVLVVAATLVSFAGISAWGTPATFQLPMPYLFFKHMVPLFGRGGMPVRFMVCTQLCIAALAVLAASELFARAATARRAALLVPVAVLGSIVAVNADTKSISAQLDEVRPLPPVFDVIRADPSPVAVYTDNIRGQWEQIQHHRPVSWARQSRLPVREREFTDTRLEKALARFETLDDPVTPFGQELLRRQLRDSGYRYFVGHTIVARSISARFGKPANELEDRRAAFMRNVLGAQLMYRDDDYVVYRFW